jgi:hopanoid biosynthesis associated protein HpnK
MILLNADDFGASSAVNQAVIRAHQAGSLHSASLMMGGIAAQEAVELAKKNPALRIGIHLTAVDGKAVLNPAEIPLIVDKEGNFPNNPAVTWIKYLFNPKASEQMQKEIKAQFEAFQKIGLKLSHVDGHHHQHIHPKIFNLAVEMGKELGAKWIRVPREDLTIWRKTPTQKQFWKAAHGKIYHWLTRGMKQKLEKEGFFIFDSVFGLLETFSLTSEYVLSLLEMNLNGSHELYFHPGANWNHDLEILLNSKIIEKIKSHPNILTDLESKIIP